MNKSKIIGRIESELLLTLFDYAVPFINKKAGIKKGKNQKAGDLENIVNSTPKISFEDVKELELSLLKNLSENIRVDKNKTINQNDVLYSLNLTRKKNKEKSHNYSISISYEENQHEDKLKISLKKAEKEIYSDETTNIKGTKDNVTPYSIKI